MSAADKLVEEGELKLAEMDFKTAFAKFKKAVETDANNARAYFGRAEAALGLEKVAPGEILRDYRKAAELDPDQAGLYLSSLGAFNLSIGQVAQAEAAFKEAATKDPDNAVTYLTDFATSYFVHAMDGAEEMSRAEADAIRYQTLVYFLNALGVTPAEAAELIEKRPKPPAPDMAGALDEGED